MPAAEISGEKADLPEIPTMVLPMKLAQVDEVGLSHVGMQRNHNEDYFFSRTKSLKINTVSGITLDTRGLYIVCDGMGGHASGEVASQLAVETLSSFFETHWQDDLPDPKTLADAVFAANQAIYDINQTNATSGLGRMGTTLVMLLVQNLSVAVVHVGDSRLYSYCKRQGLKQLTLDHEVGQREINRGIEPEIAYARPDAYQLTQALGPRHRDEVKPGISYHNIAEDTLFLLCSDGLSDNKLLERHETSHIAPMLSSKANLDNSLENLIDLANEHNGHDNITAIVTRLKLKPDMTTLPR
jgi:serine/threonine protein phosphatase PrpC